MRSTYSKVDLALMHLSNYLRELLEVNPAMTAEGQIALVILMNEIIDKHYRYLPTQIVQYVKIDIVLIVRKHYLELKPLPILKESSTLDTNADCTKTNTDEM